MEEKKESVVSEDLGCLLQGIVWGFFAFIFFMIMYVDEYLYDIILGDHSVKIILIAAVVFILSPLYLTFIKNKKVKLLTRYIVQGAFIVLFFAFTFLSCSLNEKEFSAFSTEKWINYPQYRHMMMNDLKENHGIIGMDEDEVIELLGEPDFRGEMAFSYSVDKEYREFRFIEIQFVEGVVHSVEYHVLS